MIKEEWEERGEWLTNSGRERPGGRYELEGVGRDSGTGEWAVSIGGGLSQRNSRVKI